MQEEEEAGEIKEVGKDEEWKAIKQKRMNEWRTTEGKKCKKSWKRGRSRKQAKKERGEREGTEEE